MADYRNPGDFRGANIIQGSQIFLDSKLGPALVEEKPLEAAMARFAELPLNEIPALAALSSGSYIPVRRNPLFVGREEDLKRLAAIIKAGATPAVTGLGGLGKTQLAAEFAHRWGQYFAGGVFWLNCSKPEDVPSQVAQCGGVGGLALRDDFDALNQKQQIALMRRIWRDPMPRLLVFDNCEEDELLEQWRPAAGGARVLVTSRKTNWARPLGVQTVALGTLTPAEGLALLRKYRPELAETDADVAAIAAELGYLPLALHLAGSYLERYHNASFGRPAAYLAELRRSDLLGHMSLTGGGYSPTGHELHVANTFALSWRQLDHVLSTDEMARRALIHASCFAAGEPIPRALLKTSLGAGDEAGDAERRAEDALGRAFELGLLEERTDGSLVLHRLLGAFIRREGGSDLSVARDAVEQAAFNLATKQNEDGFPAPLTAWRSHLRMITNAAVERQSVLAARLLNELGYHLTMVAEFSDARAAHERALSVDEKAYGPGHPTVARDVNNLGLVLQDLGDLAGARASFERALTIDERVYGREHPNVAIRVNNLGLALRALGDLAGARAAFERALAIGEKVYGREHPKVAISVNNLGLVLRALGDLAGARAAYERVLAINEKVYGPEHPLVATVVNNLGLVLDDLGDLPGARAAYERALAIDERVYGPDHPEVAIGVNNLGRVLRELADLPGAQAAYERALAILSKAGLPADHPSIRTVRANLESLNRNKASKNS